MCSLIQKAEAGTFASISINSWSTSSLLSHVRPGLGSRVMKAPAPLSCATWWFKPVPCALCCSPFWRREWAQGKRWGVGPHGVQGFNRSSPNTQGLPMTALVRAQDLSSTSGLFSFIVLSLAPVNCRLALTQSVCQWPAWQEQGHLCHPVGDWALCCHWLLTLSTCRGVQGGVRRPVLQELVGQVFR